MFSAFDALLYVRKTEKNRNEIRAVPASKLCILKPGHLEFEASKKENLRKLKGTVELETKGEGIENLHSINSVAPLNQANYKYFIGWLVY